jgi:hypothetical protein
MPTLFKHQLTAEIGTTPVDIVTIEPGVRATVIGCNLANITDYDTVVADVYIVGEDTTVIHYVRGLVIPPNSTAKIVTQGEKLILPPTASIRMVSDTPDSVDATVSYVEIS